MKKILFFLSFACAFFIFMSFAASGEDDITLGKLSDTEGKLRQYATYEYYGESEYFKPFSEALDSAHSYLSGTDISDEKTKAAYDALYNAYCDLVHSVFDYSAFLNVYTIAEKCDPSLFFEDSWQDFLLRTEKAKKEYEKPSLYGSSYNYSRERYIEIVQEKIDETASEYLDAFNSLDIRLPEKFNIDSLGSVIIILDAFVDEKYYSGIPGWSGYNSLLNNAKAVVLSSPSDTAKIDEAGKALVKSYRELFFAATDISPITAVINGNDGEDASLYSQELYAEYLKEYEILSAKYNGIMIFACTKLLDKDEFSSKLSDFVWQTADAVRKKKDAVPLVSDINNLFMLCDFYYNYDHTEKTAFLMEELNMAIEDAKKVAANPLSDAGAIKRATVAIHSAFSALDAANKDARKENTPLFDSDEFSSTFLFSAVMVSVALSAAGAYFIDIRKYRAANWRT